MRPLYYFAVCLLLLGFIPKEGRTQYYFKHYQVDDGLVHNSVTSLLQDSRGLIWIGTKGGLTRFDGYTFKTYLNQRNVFGSIGNNVINVLAEDKKGMLWIGTGKGIFKYDPFKEIFVPLDIAPQTYISHIAVDRQNNLWFLANYVLYKYDQRKQRVEDLKVQASCLAIDGMKLWIGNDTGMVSLYNVASRSLQCMKIISTEGAINTRSISKIYPVNNHELLIGCFKQGLKSYNINTGIVQSLRLRNNINTDLYVRDITAGSQQQYWIATESGIYIYNLSTHTSRHLCKRLGDPYSISDNAVYTICKDNQGGMWAGTFFGGVNYYSKENARFEKYYPLPGVNSISGNAIGAICPDIYGNLWIGTEDAGLNKFNLKTGEFINYSATGKYGDLSYPNIHGVLAMGNQLFVGPFLHGMEIMDIRTGKVTDRFKLVGSQHDRVSDFVQRIYLTKDSTLLIGTAYRGSGLFTYDRKYKTFSRILQIPYNSYVFDIAEDNKGTIWTGSVAQGVFYYNPKTGRHGNVRFGNKEKNKIIDEFPIHNIFEDSNYALWFATSGGGLVRLSPDRKTIRKFTVKNGLPSNFIFCVLEDQTKHLWISTLKGLGCLDLTTEKIKSYTQANGLITDQFNYNSAYKDAKGKMYFGSIKGMIAFDPAEVLKGAADPPIYITGFQINNKEIGANERNGPLKQSILFTDSILLRHDQNNFSIEFAALNFSSAKATRYKYLMKGLDKSWTYLNTNRNAFFTDLAPGNYTFLVQAESNTKSWTSRERRLFIKILPPIWKSTFAYIIYVLILSISIFLLIRSYHRYLDRKNLNKLRLFEHEKQKEIYQSKIEFFTSIAHEIQTPLTLIVGPIERLIKKVEDQPAVKKSLLMVQKNADRLADLTAQLLDFRQTEMEEFGLNFVNVNINELLSEQVTAFEEIARKSKISLSTDLSKEPIIAFVDREALIKIFSNLISNAIKYAATKVSIKMHTFLKDEEHFAISFTNDGKAIPEEFRQRIFEPFFRLNHKEKPGTGIGLPLARSLAELHNGTLELQSGKTNHIEFLLKLPVHQKIEFKLGHWTKV